MNQIQAIPSCFTTPEGIFAASLDAEGYPAFDADLAALPIEAWASPDCDHEECLDEDDDTCDFEDEPRTSTEMDEARQMLIKQIWYNQHMCARLRIETGKEKIVSEAEWYKIGYPENQNYTVDHIWAGALKRAEKIKQELGEDNCGPWTDYEWGMMNGKLSALRWVLGQDWDQLHA